MAIDKQVRIPMSHDEVFPKGLVLVGEIGPKNEFQQDRNKPARQLVDEVTGLLVWSGTVTDPDVTNSKRASFEMLWTARQQPVPSTQEFIPGCGFRPIELEGLTVTPKVAGNGEFKYLAYTFRAMGIKDVAASGKPSRSAGSAGDTSKAA